MSKRGMPGRKPLREVMSMRSLAMMRAISETIDALRWVRSGEHRDRCEGAPCTFPARSTHRGELQTRVEKRS